MATTTRRRSGSVRGGYQPVNTVPKPTAPAKQPVPVYKPASPAPPAKKP